MATHTKHFEETVQLDSGLIIPASAALGKVLTSDASGNATWSELPKPGTWEAPESLSAKIEQGAGTTYFKMEGRTENSANTARLRGTLRVKAAQTLKQFEAICTLKTTVRPSKAIIVLGAVIKGAEVLTVTFEITAAGVITMENPLTLEPTATQILFDGITWNIT